MPFYILAIWHEISILTIYICLFDVIVRQLVEGYDFVFREWVRWASYFCFLSLLTVWIFFIISLVFFRRLTAFCCLNYLITNLKLYSSIFLTIQALSILLQLWKALWLQVLWESREWTDFLCCFSLVFSLVWRKYFTCMNAKRVNDYDNLCRLLKLRYK